MLHAIGRTAMAQVQSLLCGFLQDGAFPFSSVLTGHDIVYRKMGSENIFLTRSLLIRLSLRIDMI